MKWVLEHGGLNTVSTWSVVLRVPGVWAVLEAEILRVQAVPAVSDPQILGVLAVSADNLEILQVHPSIWCIFSRKYPFYSQVLGASTYAILLCKTKLSSDHKNARLGSFPVFTIDYTIAYVLRNSDVNSDGVSCRNFATIPKIKIPFTRSIYLPMHRKWRQLGRPSRIFPLIRTFLQKIDHQQTASASGANKIITATRLKPLWDPPTMRPGHLFAIRLPNPRINSKSSEALLSRTSMIRVRRYQSTTEMISSKIIAVFYPIKNKGYSYVPVEPRCVGRECPQTGLGTTPDRHLRPPFLTLHVSCTELPKKMCPTRTNAYNSSSGTLLFILHYKRYTSTSV